MKNIRRIDPNKVREIQDVLKDCRNEGLSEQDTIFYEYKGVQKATLLEHAVIKHPIYIITNAKTNKKKMDADISSRTGKRSGYLTKRMMNPDDEIIGGPTYLSRYRRK